MKSFFSLRLLIAFSGIVFLTISVEAGEINDSEIREKLDWVESEIVKTLASRCSIQVNSMATYVQTVWWPHIQYLMRRIAAKEKQEVIRRYARLQFMLGLRKCESIEETFFQGSCNPIGVGNKNPCPQNQQLYDKADNTGYCYCLRGVPGQQNAFIYMNGQCYKQNEQGPCSNGQWLTVRNQTSTCEKVPRGCPADGKHVYWSCNDGQTECQRRRKQANTVKRCSKLGSTQPTCGAGAKLYRNGFKSYCGKPRVDWTEPNVAVVLPSRGRTCPSADRPIMPARTNRPVAKPVASIDILEFREPTEPVQPEDPFHTNIDELFNIPDDGIEISENEIKELLPDIPVRRPNRRGSSNNERRNSRKSLK